MKTLPQSCEQCLEEFDSALEDLRVYLQRAKKNGLPEPQARELIVTFEVAHELALKLMSKFLLKQGKGPYSGSRDLTAEAFHADIIDDGQGWLDIVIDRIKYNPVYEIDTQEKFLHNIQHKYIHLFERFEETMTKILN
ncbi:nucleotidyltransferase substrate binding protein [Algoriphagus machipongonensis]|uniref:Toxin-antitoxin system, antitoxin component n=1 Tax=Algoriphagus machipongonensis TaxID=388413 RepID=A3HWL2_9BACT|nr:nucleotidyltransferase substrate binding protein [Algoriphagus machipongonensis]EAZ80985.1 putative toxin-antitoxin system, antitoxin component [Algoriphagus machipongonensis]